MARLLSFAQMAENTNLDSRLVARIKELIDSYKITVRAAKDGETFVACTGSMVFSYDAVLYVSTPYAHYTIDKKRRPSDMLAKVAEYLARDVKMYGKL